MTESAGKLPEPSSPKYKRGEAYIVMKEIATHMSVCTKAWIGIVGGRVLILKDDVKGISTYYSYEEGAFTFFDRKGGSQVVQVDEITEVAGY